MHSCLKVTCQYAFQKYYKPNLGGMVTLSTLLSLLSSSFTCKFWVFLIDEARNAFRLGWLWLPFCCTVLRVLLLTAAIFSLIPGAKIFPPLRPIDCRCKSPLLKRLELTDKSKMYPEILTKQVPHSQCLLTLNSITLKCIQSQLKARLRHVTNLCPHVRTYSAT